MRAIHEGRGGSLTSVPNYSVASRLFNEPSTTPVLLGLLELSAIPLKAFEHEEPIAIDSTGFPIGVRGEYNSQKHGVDRPRKWIKLHSLVGVRTHLVLSARITDEHGADSPQLIPMLKEVVSRGYAPKSLMGDKAYTSRANYDAARSMGVDGYFPFRSNTTGRAGGSQEWSDKFYQFMSHRPEFEREYHPRSLVESFHSAIKRRLGESLLSRNPLAQLNELIARLISYNLGILILAAHKHRIDLTEPGFHPEHSGSASFDREAN
jgi:transposase